MTELRVFWDAQDPDNEGWAYRLLSSSREESGALDMLEPNDLDLAIDEACLMLDIDATHEDFAKGQDSGGYGIWTKEEW